MKRVLLCAVLLASSAMASTIVYKWVDAQGKLQYGDRPPDSVHAQVVEMPGSHASQSAANRASDSRPAPKVPAASSEPSSNSDPGAQKAVDADVAQSKEKQCADAQDRYKKLIEGRKLYKAGADGQRQYLTSDEIDAERLDAKRDVDTICNSAS